MKVKNVVRAFIAIVILGMAKMTADMPEQYYNGTWWSFLIMSALLGGVYGMADHLKIFES